MSYKPERWQLQDLLPSPEAVPGTPEMETYVKGVRDKLSQFRDLRAGLSAEMRVEDFLKVLRLYEALNEAGNALMAYSYLWFSEDTANQDALTYRATVHQMVAEMENDTLFFTLWWKGLDDPAAQRFLTASGDNRYFLEALRLLKPHTLTEAEEKIVNIKDVNGMNTVLTIYDMITTGLKFHLTLSGKEVELTRGQLMAYVSSPDAGIRAKAYQELLNVFKEHTDVLAQIYSARVRDWTEEQVKLRGISSPVSVRNLANDIPDPVVETLLSVIRDNVGLFQRFFKFKAGQLGLDKLRRYDLYAPLSETEKEYSFEDAIALVDEAYRAFSSMLADKARQVLDEHHLDAEVRSRKMDGAYCYGVLPGVTPWVLTNYTGKIRDVSTLAHELGHAVHAMLADKHSVLTFHSALPMAETASVFGEMLMTDKLLDQETDPLVRRTLLSTFLDDAYATITRQAFFVIFEKTAHEMVLNGATPDQLQTAYLENLAEQFGDAMELSDDFRVEWIAIPHIYHTPFYCYAYAFGNLLVLALYRKYKEIGKAFEADYLRILAYGGSASPNHIISEAGFDMASPEFWQSGFDLLAGMLEELEHLS